MSDITSKITVKNKIQGKIEATKIYPDLENLTVTPSKQQQSFNHKDSYGYDNVIVKGIDCNSINITPTKNKQVFEGMYDNVTVDGVQGEILNITPSETQQSKTGLYETVNVEAIQTEEKVPTLDFGVSNEVEITPTTGKYIKKVTINKPANLVPDIIKAGENVFGIKGSLEKLDTSDADATADDIAFGKVAYANDQKLVGTMTVNNNNALIDTSVYFSTILSSMNTIAVMDFTGIDTSKYTNANAGFQTFRALQEVIGLDCTTITNMNRMFYYCENLIDAELLNSGNVTTLTEMFYCCFALVDAPTFDTSSVTTMSSMYYQCSSLVNAAEFNTSKVSKMDKMYYNCKKLVSVPVYDTSKVTTMVAMFTSCSNLSDESLNNIMQMCINATSYTATKTLKSVGLTTAQATRCQSLSNYQAFLDAGWQTGF